MSPVKLVTTKPPLSTNSFRVVGLVVVGVCLAAIAAHLQLVNSSEDATGLLAVLDHTFDLILALGLSVLILLAGRGVAQRFDLEFVSAAEEISFSFFLGTGVVGLSVLCLGLLGLLRPWPVGLLLAFYTAMTVRGVPPIYKAIKKGLRATTLTRESRVVAALFLCLLAILILRTTTPPNTADELIYHLPVTKQFVRQGRIHAFYDNSLGNVPFLIQMIYALCLMAGSDIAAKFFSLFLAITTTFALYGFCSRFLTRRVGIVAMFAFFAAGIVVELAVTTRIDVSLAGMLFATTYAMINYLTSKRRGWLWISAILAGFSLGIKHTAALWLLLVGVMYLIETIRTRERFGKILKLGVAYTFVALAAASPWYIKNYLWFHNPIYPFVTGEVAEFGEKGVRYFNAEDERRLDAHFDLARKEIPEAVSRQEEDLRQAINARVPRHPMRLWEFFTKPSTYLMSEPYQFPNYLFLIIPFMVFLKKDKWVVWLLILSLAFVFSVTLTSWIARYLLPAYPPLTIVAAYTLTTISTRLGERISFARRVPVYALAVALATVIATCAASFRQFHSPSFVAGTISRHEFMAPLSYYRPINFINTQLPPNARVMIIGAQMNYGIKRDYLTDESWFATKWRRLLVRNDSLEGVNEDLKRQGFTHIFYNPELFTYAALMGVQGTGGMNLIARGENEVSEEATRLGPEYPLLRNWSTFTLFRMKFLEPVYSDENGYQIFKIR